MSEATSAPSSRSDDEIFEEIGRGLLGTPIAAGIVDDGEFQSSIQVGLQALDDLRELGSRIFARISREMYDVICGSSRDDSADRKNIVNAAGLSEPVVFASLVSTISANFGFTTAMCTAIATIILRRIVKPAGNEICKYWGERYL